MNTLINILLSILGLIATLSAFGGKTWKEGQDLLIKRITKRGYISLFCLFLTFSIAVYKELHTNKIIDQKDLKIDKLQSEIVKLEGQISSYKDVLNIVKDRSDRIEQTIMAEAVKVHGTWHAANYIYPGSIARFYTFDNNPNNNLTLRYGNQNIGYTSIKININAAGDGRAYEIPIFGNSGEQMDFELIGDWEGKIFIYSTPRIRDTERSWKEETHK